MQIQTKHKLSDSEKNQIVSLWNNEFPAQLHLASSKDFELYLEPLMDCNHSFLVDGSKTIHGWIMDFERDGERWFAMILSREKQGKGFGTTLINHIKARNSALKGWGR